MFQFIDALDANHGMARNAECALYLPVLERKLLTGSPSALQAGSALHTRRQTSIAKAKLWQRPNRPHGAGASRPLLGSGAVREVNLVDLNGLTSPHPTARPLHLHATSTD